MSSRIEQIKEQKSIQRQLDYIHELLHGDDPDFPKPNAADLFPIKDEPELHIHTSPKVETNLSLYPPNQKIDSLKIKKICGIKNRIFLPSMYPKDVERLRKYYNETGKIPQDIQEEAEKLEDEFLYRSLLNIDARKELDQFHKDYKEAVYKMQQEGQIDLCQIDFLRYKFWSYLLGSKKRFEKYYDIMDNWNIHTFDGSYDFSKPGQHHSMWMDKLMTILPKKYKQVFPPQVLKTDSHL